MELSTQFPLVSIRASVLVQLFEWSKIPYKFFFKRKVDPWKTTMEDLSEMAHGSLGQDLYQFMTQHQFEIEAKLESHDVSHVLLEYPTNVSSEISMQYFFLGNQKPSLYTQLTVILGFLVLPEYYREYREAYQRGKQALPIHQWKLEHLLHEKTTSLRALIFNYKHENNLFI